MSYNNSNSSARQSPSKPSALGKRSHLMQSRDTDEREIIDVSESPTHSKLIAMFQEAAIEAKLTKI